MFSCPNCHFPSKGEKFVCPNCGSDLQTGKQGSESQTISHTKENTDSKNRQMLAKEKHFIHRMKRYMAYLIFCLKHPLSNLKKDVPESYLYWKISLLLLVIFNTLTVTLFLKQSLSYYEWFARISLLPSLKIAFLPLLFSLRTLIFLALAFPLLPLLMAGIRFYSRKGKWQINDQMNQFFGSISLSIFLSFIAMILAFSAPILFLLVIICLLVIEVIILIVAVSFFYFKENLNLSPLNTYSLILLTCIIYICCLIILGILIY